MRNALWALLLLVHCGSGNKSDQAQAPPPQQQEAEKQEPAAEKEQVFVRPDESDQFFKLDGEFAASHILVAYKGAQNAGAHITRTREAAREKAVQVLAGILEDEATFESVAREASDGLSAPAGGNLGSWVKGTKTPRFEAVINGLRDGEIYSEPIETESGFHIVRRNPLQAKHYTGFGFFIAYRGSPDVPAIIVRSRDEARILADGIAVRLNADNFESLAAEYNDLGSGSLDLGIIKPGDMVPIEIPEALESIAYGEVIGPVELPIGFAFMKRTRVERRAGAHILISFKGAENARPWITRSRDEAEKIALDLINELDRDPSLFPEVARKYSDDGVNAREGGLPGLLVQG